MSFIIKSIWNGGISLKYSARNLSSSGIFSKAFSDKYDDTIEVDPDPIRQVFWSQSTDIYSNLALEDWLYNHHDFAHKHMLLLWRNEPCVVIGRHQNPWVEANVPFLRDNQIDIARRNSGGGTVYHDLGNINCTFFTRRDQYRRRHNLDIICNAIRRITALDVRVNEREDIVLDTDHKISGTAAKLGRKNAYHHCTVLVDVNAVRLHDSLRSNFVNYESRATQSVKVPVQNVRAVSPNVSVMDVLEAIGYEWLRTDINGNDVGRRDMVYSGGFQKVRPDDDWFPGLGKIRDELHSFAWIFGKTPKFKVRRSFYIPPPMRINTQDCPENFHIELDINKGKIEDTRAQVPLKVFDGFDKEYDLSKVLIGLPFSHQLPDLAYNRMDQFKEPPRQYLSCCLKDIIDRIV